jgi:hypothetical protein
MSRILRGGSRPQSRPGVDVRIDDDGYTRRPRRLDSLSRPKDVGGAAWRRHVHGVSRPTDFGGAWASRTSPKNSNVVADGSHPAPGLPHGRQPLVPSRRRGRRRPRQRQVQRPFGSSRSSRACRSRRRNQPWRSAADWSASSTSSPPAFDPSGSTGEEVGGLGMLKSGTGSSRASAGRSFRQARRSRVCGRARARDSSSETRSCCDSPRARRGGSPAGASAPPRRRSSLRRRGVRRRSRA